MNVERHQRVSHEGKMFTRSKYNQNQLKILALVWNIKELRDEWYLEREHEVLRWYLIEL